MRVLISECLFSGENSKSNFVKKQHCHHNKYAKTIQIKNNRGS